MILFKLTSLWNKQYNIYSWDHKRGENKLFTSLCFKADVTAIKTIDQQHYIDLKLALQ